ncbi:MAG: M20/M25/M40 family metallo-hydrolase [Clostridiales bacterium]|nr:M20/M25/M40 family metallo-hydrolase [Clostridiales bacterium]
MNNIKNFIKENSEDLFKTIKELAVIPAPSNDEGERAEFCKNWLINKGIKSAYIDEAQNVIVPMNIENSSEITVIEAHTDIVFERNIPLNYVDDGKYIHCPGISDDTVSAVVLMKTIEYYYHNNFDKPVLFVLNSGEEGLGNLRGTRQIFKDFEGRIKQFVTYDSTLAKINTRCVGSHRYLVTVKTEGGHSYTAFGNENAINQLAQIVNEIYKIQVHNKENAKTSYNVGTILGGTSVNTIAQQAQMLCEYRSDDIECLGYMKNQFNNIFENAKNKGVDLTVELVGERPCMAKDIDIKKIDMLYETCKSIIENVYKEEKVFSAPGSTDCNIPLSLKVPAVCIGVCNGFKSHTYEEYVEKTSIPLGLEISINLVSAITK